MNEINLSNKLTKSSPSDLYNKGQMVNLRMFICIKTNMVDMNSEFKFKFRQYHGHHVLTAMISRLKTNGRRLSD